MRVTIALVVWAAAVVGAIALSSAVAGSIHTSPRSVASAGPGQAGGSAGSTSPDPSSIRATDPSSMFRTANFSAALAKARAAVGAGAGIDNFAIYPGYISLTAVKGGSEVDLYMDANGNVEQTATGGSPGGTTLFRLSQISPTVPDALARRIATAGRTPESQLHYMVVEIDPTSSKLEWLVYPLEGNHVEYFKAPGATGQLLEYRTSSSTGPQPVSG